MRRLEQSVEDMMAGIVTYEFEDGTRHQFDVRQIREHGIEKLARYIGAYIPMARIPVLQSGRRIGTVPGSFEPICIESKTIFYAVRGGDFVRDGECWVASPTLMPGDLEAVPDFQWDKPCPK